MIQSFGSKGRNPDSPSKFYHLLTYETVKFNSYDMTIYFDPWIHGPWSSTLTHDFPRDTIYETVHFYFIVNIFWNVIGAFCPDGEPSIRTKPCDLTTQPCDDCYNQYDKCDKISTSYCTDVRYADRLERLCQKHCGHCSSRKRRRRRRIQSEDTASYQALDALLIGLSLR